MITFCHSVHSIYTLRNYTSKIIFKNEAVFSSSRNLVQFHGENPFRPLPILHESLIILLSIKSTGKKLESHWF